jgi:carbonic anhydrase
MERLIAVRAADDVPDAWRETPIERLLACQNLGAPLDPCDRPELLIGMCMDYRKHLRIPENFAYILRSGGGNLRPSAFKVSFAIAVGGVRAIALIGHDRCGMVNLTSKEDAFVDGLVDVGWDREEARDHFRAFAPHFEIGDEIGFLVSEAARLRRRYPKVLVAPLLYRLDDDRLYLVREA